MPNKTHYIAEIEHRVCGIPCLIGVTHYDRVKGSYSYNAPSDLDYYGYSESEWEILDRKGYKAAWLERKMTDYDRDNVEEAISGHFG